MNPARQSPAPPEHTTHLVQIGGKERTVHDTPWSLAMHASLTTSEPRGSVPLQPNAQQRASSEGVRLKWGKSGAKPALSRSCNRAVQGSGARMPASAWMPESPDRQATAAMLFAAAPRGRGEAVGSSFPCLIDRRRH